MAKPVARREDEPAVTMVDLAEMDGSDLAKQSVAVLYNQSAILYHDFFLVRNCATRTNPTNGAVGNPQSR